MAKYICKIQFYFIDSGSSSSPSSISSTSSSEGSFLTNSSSSSGGSFNGLQNCSPQCVHSVASSDTILPQFFCFVILSGEAWIQYQLEYVYTSNLKLGIGVNQLISHNKREPYFGQFRDNDEVYLYLRYGF